MIAINEKDGPLPVSICINELDMIVLFIAKQIDPPLPWGTKLMDALRVFYIIYFSTFLSLSMEFLEDSIK